MATRLTTALRTSKRSVHATTTRREGAPLAARQRAVSTRPKDFAKKIERFPTKSEVPRKTGSLLHEGRSDEELRGGFLCVWLLAPGPQKTDYWY
jgi:hypothetical protein